MQNTPSQTKKGKGVGHVCSSCGRLVECDLNTDLYEACQKVLPFIEGMFEEYPYVVPQMIQVLNKALAKVEG